MPRQYTPRVVLNCAQCGITFALPPSIIDAQRGKFCSKQCYYNFRRVDPDIRFWRKVVKGSSPDDCWLWDGIQSHHYASFEIGRGYSVGAHRFSYEIAYGPIPEGLFVLHSCPKGDTKSCVNPAHLRIGTAADNSRDMVERGQISRGDMHASHLRPERRPRGSKHAQTKLTEADVLEMRQLWAAHVPLKEIAQKFGITSGTVKQIAAGRTWRHVPLVPKEPRHAHAA